MAAVGIYAMRRKWFNSIVMNVTYLPILNPEIVTGVSMLLLFVSFSNGIQKFNTWIGGTAFSFLQLPELQLGFLTRTPRGRCVTQKAYEHLHVAFVGQQRLDL